MAWFYAAEWPTFAPPLTPVISIDDGHRQRPEHDIDLFGRHASMDKVTDDFSIVDTRDARTGNGIGDFVRAGCRFPLRIDPVGA